MIYPNYIKKGDTIGITAPSDGITDELKLIRVDNSKKKLIDYGYKVIETDSVRKSIKGKSNTNENICKELNSLYTNDNVKYIMCATGGDFLVELLPFIEYNTIKNNIKWIQGYSDITALLFTITTNLDIATVYGYNIGTYGMDNWHKSLYDSINLLEGTIDTEFSYDYYEDGFSEMKTGTEEFEKDLPVCWKCINNIDEVSFKGRIIGGCIDVILSLLGTKYDKTNDFIEKYKKDGIIWYFDNCELSSEAIIRAMWQMENCGYFKYTKGIIFGRSMTLSSYYDISFEQALNRSLGHLMIPIIYDVDIGHKHPSMSIINGSMATINYSKNKGNIKQELI